MTNLRADHQVLSSRVRRGAHRMSRNFEQKDGEVVVVVCVTLCRLKKRKTGDERPFPRSHSSGGGGGAVSSACASQGWFKHSNAVARFSGSKRSIGSRKLAIELACSGSHSYFSVSTSNRFHGLRSWIVRRSPAEEKRNFVSCVSLSTNRIRAVFFPFD